MGTVSVGTGAVWEKRTCGIPVSNPSKSLTIFKAIQLILFSAKYLLSITNYLLQTLGPDQAISYDIGCAFLKTVDNSQMVGPTARAKHARIHPNAFHGWLHSRLCQVQNHPLYQSGFGIEDFEVMERIFSSSNGVAQCTRFAAVFHWKQFFDLHFRQWDDDKYEELSMCFQAVFAFASLSLVSYRQLSV